MEREYYHDCYILTNMKINGRRIRVGRLIKKEFLFCEIWGMKLGDFSDVAESIL
jgi:hypothetical protein